VAGKSSPNLRDSQPRIARIFFRFRGQYGDDKLPMLADRNLMAVTLTEWQCGLSEFSDAQIDAATGKAPEQYPDWPPTLGQFRKICKAEAEGNGPAHPYFRALPESAEERKRLDAIGQEIFAKLRKDGVIG
jgi:hypothetical protein